MLQNSFCSTLSVNVLSCCPFSRALFSKTCSQTKAEREREREEERERGREEMVKFSQLQASHKLQCMHPSYCVLATL